MKKYPLLTILILTTILSVVWTGILPQICCARGDGVEHAALRKGWVDKLDGERLVIDDMAYILTEKTRFFGKGGKVSGRSVLREGQFVGFLCDNNKLTDIYILNPGEGDRRPAVNAPTRSGSRGNSEIILEDGVWRN